MSWNTQTWKHDQKKYEIIKGTNTFSQQCIYNGALAKEKKVVPVCLKTDTLKWKSLLLKLFRLEKGPNLKRVKGMEKVWVSFNEPVNIYTSSLPVHHWTFPNTIINTETATPGKK